MHTLIDNSQIITHWIYYHTTAKLGNPWILNWFSKEAPRLIIHKRTSEVGLETLFNIREVIKKRLPLRPVTTIHTNHSSLYCTFLLIQMGVKFKTTNNLEFLPCLRNVAKAKIDIKMIWRIFAPILFEKNPANNVL